MTLGVIPGPLTVLCSTPPKDAVRRDRRCGSPVLRVTAAFFLESAVTHPSASSCSSPAGGQPPLGSAGGLAPPPPPRCCSPSSFFSS